MLYLVSLRNAYLYHCDMFPLFISNHNLMCVTDGVHNYSILPGLFVSIILVGWYMKLGCYKLVSEWCYMILWASIWVLEYTIDTIETLEFRLS